ncbi:MAG: gliding motility-associated C-terminal domain-containing protein [Bacteroidetes bacterium]|nr:gliding motility-associated C-terminal domain-containing protein [Bacteroidota bacterium]
MRILRHCAILFLLITVAIPASASHYMGGEITWTCLANGKYKFTMKCYRECAGIDYSQTTQLTVTNYPTTGSTFQIAMNRISRIDRSPVCNPAFPGITCATTDDPNTGGVEEHVYESADVTLSGVPPAGGWVFSWSDCCRNPCSNISQADGKSWTLRAVMYSYNGQNANPCYDNSPTFAEPPSPVLPVGYAFTYNHNAVDRDLDSLAFEWATPLEDNITDVLTGWEAGYSFLSPLPSTYHHANNVPATVNPYTGEIKFTSFTQGAFVNVVKVSSYRCGVKISEIFREMQVVLIPSVNPNYPSVVTAPFQNPVSGLFDTYIDTVYAGDIVEFDVAGEDYDLLPDNSLQTMTITASGSQFGAGYTSTTTGCLTPPCATLTPPPPVIGQYYVSSHFRWETSCQHIVAVTSSGGCLVDQHIYTFVLKVKDDDCPVPGLNFITITVVVLAKPILPAPVMACTQVLENGDVVLHWNQVENDSLNSFYAYEIYTSSNPTSGFTVLDSIMDISQESYTHSGAGANSAQQYYYIRTRSSCYGLFYSAPTDTVSSILLNVTGNGSYQALLNWNAPHSPLLPGGQLPYIIYREYPEGVWTVAGNSNTTSFTDNDITLDGCTDSTISYRIELADTSGCTSVSNVDSADFQSGTLDLEPPDLRCVAVSESGEARLSWLLPPEQGTYICYYVYASNSISGPYSKIDSIFNFNTSDYSHTTASANTGSRFYFLTIKYGCYGELETIASDTLSSMYLVAVANPGTAQLVWNPIHSPPLPTTSLWYKIYRRAQGGSWTLIDSVQTNAYIDTIQVCQNYISYRVDVSDVSGCVSVSSVASDNFSDEIPPVTPLLDTVSVNPITGEVTISWNINPSSDTYSYVVYMFNAAIGAYQALDTIIGRYNVSYIHTSSGAASRSVTYTVAAIDSCGNISSYCQPHKTIFLENLSDVCSQTADLFWCTYLFMPNGVRLYNVYMSVDGSNYILIDSKAANDSTATVIDLINQSTYCFYVQAVDSTGHHSASSNKTCFTLVLPSLPQYCYIRYATVVDNHQDDVVFTSDNPNNVKQYDIFRSDTVDNNFLPVYSILAPGAGDTIYTDLSVNTDETVYYYKVEATDSCGNLAAESNIANTIFLAAEARTDMTNMVTWNPYAEWPLGVGVYKVYRKIDDIAESDPCFILFPDSIWAIDDVSALYPSEGNFCYYVEAIEEYGNPMGFRDSSRSNVVCVEQFPRFFVPNAFVPVGFNREFKPVAVFVDKTDYLFQIYDRWGERIFETTDYNVGWNGRYHGKLVQSGAYAYYFRFRDAAGNVIEKTGSVTVIK